MNNLSFREWLDTLDSNFNWQESYANGTLEEDIVACVKESGYINLDALFETFK